MAKPKRLKVNEVSYVESSDDDPDYLDATMENQVTKSRTKSYTYAELCEYLKLECGDEFNYLPKIDTLTFESWAGPRDDLTLKPVVKKRIHFGDTRSPQPHLNDKVYIYIGDEKNNRIGLVACRDGTAIELSQASLVETEKPFWYLFSHGRALDNAEEKRLRALTCFFFLAGGHVKTIGDYPDFLKHLSDAVVWYGRGLEVESKEHTTAVNSDGFTINSNFVHDRNNQQNQAHTAEGSTVQNGAQVLRPLVQESQMDSGKQRVDSEERPDSWTDRLQESYDQIAQRMTDYHAQVRLIAREADGYADLKHRSAEQTKELERLQEQMEEKDRKIVRLTREASRQQQFSVFWRGRFRWAVRDRGAEREKRLAAEKRLERIRKAQEKFTAMLDDPTE